MHSVAQSDGHNGPRLLGEAVPGATVMVEDVVLAAEHVVRKPVRVMAVTETWVSMMAASMSGARQTAPRV